jgi:hypothetical protein
VVKKPLLLFCFLLACLTPVDKVGEGDDPGECDDGIDNDQDGYLDQSDAGCLEEEMEIIPEVIVVWDVSSLRIDLSKSDSTANYNIGIVENAGDCLDESNCWTGEDCFQGFQQEDNTLLYCHPFYAGTTLDIEYGALPGEVNEGETTVFSDRSFRTVVTFILNDQRSGQDGSCWVWGADTSYYENYPKVCLEM